ncbi:hypothetical protein SAMN06265349_101690 [Flavobacterium resistens]|uniref:Uncharacterized protein n=1 Tax=Flavobacterium resistens TaxID=443612 RepID=A0A521B575_9FLAO|nr:hypothetical protein [Flavobacterium resistens]MRX70305.1 hypothetical protein [Flavobacterium resistens]SMO42201.1 hypothetical protein SAMN06265349_101690 [Flavobacterium resistens]
MNNQTGDTIVEGIFYGLNYLGALFHWLAFFGRKSFQKVLESGFINSIIGIIVLVLIVILFKNEVLHLILYLIKKYLNQN